MTISRRSHELEKIDIGRSYSHEIKTRIFFKRARLLMLLYLISLVGAHILVNLDPIAKIYIEISYS